MNLIRSLMGRRQFLIAAGVTSASALALNKLSESYSSTMTLHVTFLVDAAIKSISFAGSSIESSTEMEVTLGLLFKVIFGATS